MKIVVQETNTGLTIQEVKEAEYTLADFAVQHLAIQKTLFDAKGDLAVATAADTPARLPVGADGYALVADSGESAGMKWQALAGGNVGLVYAMYEGGGVLTTGDKHDIPIPANLTLTEVMLLGRPTGSMVVDLQKCTYNQYDNSTHPVSGDSICSASKPTISAGLKTRDTTLSGWTTSFSTDDILRVAIDSCTSIVWASLMLVFERA